MTQAELSAWASRNGWQMLAGCPSLMKPGRPKDAISVLRAAQGLAKTPEELATVRGRIQAIEQRQPNAEANRQSIAAVATGKIPPAPAA